MLKDYGKPFNCKGLNPFKFPSICKKKMTAPVLAHRSGQAKQTRFEVNVSTSIEHYITPGLVLHTLFSESQVI